MILPFIKKDGIICGAYTCDEKQQRNYEKVFCSKEKMLKLMDSYKLRLVEATEIGPFTEESNCSDKQSYEGIYVSKKSTLG